MSFSLKLILAYSAERTNKILGHILPLGAGSYAALLVSFFLVVYPSAYAAYIFHSYVSFRWEVLPPPSFVSKVYTTHASNTIRAM